MSKSVVVTGASSGFGKLTVELLAKNGYKVFATMRGIEGKNAEQANAIKSFAASENVDISVVELDVTSDESVEAARAEIVAQSPKIDVVVNNAGIYGGGIDEAFSVEDYKKIFEGNVFGVLRVMRAFLPSMRSNNDGLFVQVSSIMGRFVIPYAGAYTSSKWAIEAVAENLRYELAPLGIDSVIVQPGAFQTEIFSKVYQPENQAVMADYGTSAEILQGFMENFGQIMGGEIPNKVEHVAEAIKTLIETPKGESPLRVAVDKMEGTAEPLNATSVEVQKGFLGNMGMDVLLQTKA